MPVTNFAVFPTGSITHSNGTFTLVTPGTYLVTAILNIPQTTNLDTVVRIIANTQPIPSTLTHVRATSDTGTHVLQAIVVSDGTTTVGFTGADALDLTADATTDVLLSMVFERLS